MPWEDGRGGYAFRSICELEGAKSCVFGPPSTLRSQTKFEQSHWVYAARGQGRLKRNTTCTDRPHPPGVPTGPPFPEKAPKDLLTVQVLLMFWNTEGIG